MFAGWFTDKEALYSQESLVVSDMDLHALWTASKADKTMLEELYGRLKGEEAENYEKESYEKLKQVLSEAKEVLGDDKASQTQVNRAILKLEAAENNLVALRNKDKLREEISKAEKLDLEKYESQSARELEDALKEAHDVEVNPKATQKAINQATDKLRKAQENLKVQIEFKAEGQNSRIFIVGIGKALEQEVPSLTRRDSFWQFNGWMDPSGAFYQADRKFVENTVFTEKWSVVKADIAISIPKAKIGEKVTVRVTGVRPGQKVDFELHSVPTKLGSSMADTAGVAILEFTITPDMSLGQHKVYAFYNQDNEDVELQIGLEIIANKTKPDSEDPGADQPGGEPTKPTDSGNPVEEPSKTAGSHQSQNQDGKAVGQTGESILVIIVPMLLGIGALVLLSIRKQNKAQDSDSR